MTIVMQLPDGVKPVASADSVTLEAIVTVFDPYLKMWIYVQVKIKEFDFHNIGRLINLYCAVFDDFCVDEKLESMALKRSQNCKKKRSNESGTKRPVFENIKMGYNDDGLQ